MTLHLASTLIELQQMTVDELRSKYAEVFGEPTGARHKNWLVKRIAWRLQALAEGGLSERAQRRAAELARIRPATFASEAERNRTGSSEARRGNP